MNEQEKILEYRKQFLDSLQVALHANSVSFKSLAEIVSETAAKLELLSCAINDAMREQDIASTTI